MSQTIYLDYAAATPLDPRVEAAMRPYWQELFYNPSATYLAARQVAKDLQHARETVAHWLGVHPTEVVFTAGGTESDNLAIQGIMQRYPGAKLAVSAIEHEAVLRMAAQYSHTVIPVTADGLVRVDTLEQVIDDETVLVSVMYANNEVGTVQPIRRIAQFAADIRTKRRTSGNDLPLYVHTDASQAANYLDIHASRLGVDLMTLNGGKIYGPKQTGALYVRAGVVLEPLIRGGGQERGLRSGTENVAGAIGFAAALDIAQSMREPEVRRLQKLQQQCINQLQQAIPSIIINGSQKHRLPNNIHFTIPGIDNERVVMQLDEAGIQCAVGSACSASHDEPSHVLKAMGMSDGHAQASVRLTMGRGTSDDAMATTVKELIKLA